MRYSQSTELALDSLFFMAAHPEQREFAVEEIALAQRVSASYLAKIFQQLVKAGLLRSQRGARGGYALGRQAREISLGDVAQVFEGASPLYDCNASVRSCTLGPKCLIVSTFREAEQKMQAVLQGVSLEDLVLRLRENAGNARWVGVSESVSPPASGKAAQKTAV